MSRLTVYPTLDEYERQLPDFADRLAIISSDKLKKMARVWVGKDAYKLNKESAIQTLKRSLRDPKAIRQLAENLTAVERDGLMLMKLRGRRVAYIEELAAELVMLHPIPPHPKTGYRAPVSHYERLNEMLERGLLIRCDRRNEGIGNSYYSYYNSCEAVAMVADFFQIIKITPPSALRLSTITETVAAVSRRPSELLLELTSFAQAFDRLGSLSLTAKGLYANPSIAKLNKLLGWSRAEERDHQPAKLPSLEFYLQLFLAANLLKANYSSRAITANPEHDISSVLEEPFPIQARLWAQAYRSLNRWVECIPHGASFYPNESLGRTKFNGIRAALLLSLGLLPDPAAWYRIADLSELMRDRIGRHFALGYKASYHASWNATPEKQAEALVKYETEFLANWQQREHVWIEQAFRGPLFHLCLVELAQEPKSKSQTPTLFRLSEAGRAALYDIFRQPAKPDGNATPTIQSGRQTCWIVQPNFEVIVYLDQASPRQLGFMERIGTRQKSDATIAVYRLTRESIYFALENGIAGEQLLQTLESGSQHSLPPGVERTLSDWTARRDRLTVRFNARVIEFSNFAERDAIIKKNKIKGIAIGERFLLVEEKEQAITRSLHLGGTINYQSQPRGSLVVNDDGTVLIMPGLQDLLVIGELSAFAEPGSDIAIWRITRKSVQAARDRGWTAEDIINRLNRRTTTLLPSFLKFAIKAWWGNKTAPGPTSIATPPLLQTSTAEVADAIIECSFVNPYLLARIGTCAILIKPDSVKALGKLLDEYGFAVGKEVLLPAAPPPEKTK